MSFKNFQLEIFTRLCFLCVGFVYFFSQILFFSGKNINYTNTLIIVILSLSLSNLCLKNKKIYYNLLLIILFGLLFIIANVFIDFTWDGQAYHQEMTMRMVDSWNPIYTKEGGVWVYHYPKAYETIGSFIYYLFGTIKATKLLNILFFLILFFYSHAFFKRHYTKKESYLISCIISLNPIFLCQLTSNLVDGFLYATTIILVLSYLQLRNNKMYLLDFFLALIILINIKYTGLVFAIAIVGYIFFNELILKRGREKNIKRIFIVALMASPFLYTPYIKNNLIENNHLFHPLMGENKIDFSNDYVPDIIKPYNKFSRIFLTNFITVTNSSEGKFKIPFTFSIKELQRFRNGGPRGGGLGVWWSAILILSFTYYLIIIFRHRKKFKPSHYEYIILCILFFVFINDAGWWFRYTPFVWLIPLLLILSAKKFTSNTFLELGFFMMVLINGLLTLSITFGAIYLDTKRFEKKLAKLNSNKIYKIHFGSFYGNKTLLKEYGVKFIETNKTNFTNPKSINSEVFYDNENE